MLLHLESIAVQPTVKYRPPLLLICFAAIVPMLVGLQLSDHLRIGEDEGYELLKASMVRRGIPMYSELWNDQPPLLTYILTIWFSVFGENVGVARHLASTFGTLLVWSLGVCVHHTGRPPWPKLVTVALTAFIFLGIEYILPLCVSIMAEVPAFALGLGSIYLVFRGTEQDSKKLLRWGGLILALGAMIKLTVLLLLPAIVLEMVFNQNKSSRHRLQHLCTFGGTFCLVFTISFVILISSGGLPLISNHFSNSEDYLRQARFFRFDLKELWPHWDLICFAFLSISVAVLTNHFPLIRFPFILLATVSVVHLVHSPWWHFYWVHFAVPLSWLAMLGAIHVLKEVTLRLHSRTKGVIRTICLISSLCVLIWKGSRRLGDAVHYIGQQPKISESRLLAKVSRMGGARSIFANDCIISFYSGKIVLPEVALLPRKRFWSGQISEEEVARALALNRPDILVLREVADSHFKELISIDYVSIFAEGKETMYIRSHLYYGMQKKWE